MKKILVIDNYDSFTYNLVYYIGLITGVNPDVFRNDEITLSEINEYDKILLSPGPGVPQDAGICIELIKQYAESKSILGICLGHQAVCEALGGSIHNLPQVYHGISSNINITNPPDPLFAGLPSGFTAGRYHSWAVNKLPDTFNITCADDDGIIMGISHKEYDVRGLQFHPESVMTDYGMDIIKNWIEI